MIVSVNKFYTDTDGELEIVKKKSEEAGAEFFVSEHFSQGGKGSLELAVGIYFYFNLFLF